MKKKRGEKGAGFIATSMKEKGVYGLKVKRILGETHLAFARGIGAGAIPKECSGGQRPRRLREVRAPPPLL
jgi:hypothetical protein